MTGLYNKITTEELIRDALQVPCRGYCLHALLILDIDEFKRVNDTAGHAFGDAVILHVSETLKKNLRVSDIIGRIGGDEFAVFLSDIPSLTHLSNIADKLVHKLNETVEYEETQMRISTSIGIAYAWQDELNYEALYKLADDALYEAKATGRNCYFMQGSYNSTD